MKKNVLTVLCFFFLSSAFAQSQLSKEDITVLSQREDTLLILADSMYHAFIPDTRPEYCEKFVRAFVQTLKMPGSYQYPFPRLGEVINIIGPEDKSFRIFNWVLATSRQELRYYGAIQIASNELKLYGLADYSAQLGKPAEDSLIRSPKWFGALYYRILTKEAQGEKVYMLFGLNNSSPIVSKKIIDPMIVREDGVIFGAPVFALRSETSEKPILRFVMEYKRDVSASLNWDTKNQRVYFDHLVSQMNDPNRKYTFVPSGQYDGLVWKNDQWHLVRDIMPVQALEDGEAPQPLPMKSNDFRKR